MNSSTTARGVVLLALLCARGVPVFSQTGETDKSEPERTVFTAREVTRRAQVISKVEPPYTEEARKNEITGTVRVRLVLNATGEVTNVTPVTELPYGLTDKAVEAARKIKFTPALKDGRPVSQWAVVDYNFDIYYDLDEVSRPPSLVSVPQPVMTEEARQRKVRGTVVLEVALTRLGTAHVVRVIKGLPHGLTESAIEAAKQIKFQPALKGSRPVSTLVETNFKFPPEEGDDKRPQ